MSSIHRRHANPNLKTSLICLAITVCIVGGLTVTEQVLYRYIFPESSDQVEIDDVLFDIGVGWSRISSYFNIRIRLYTNLSTGIYPQVNATKMWLIPSVGIWAWRNYEVINLVFAGVYNGTSYRIDYEGEHGYLPNKVPNQVDIIIGLNATGNREYFLHYFDVDLYYQ